MKPKKVLKRGIMSLLVYNYNQNNAEAIETIATVEKALEKLNEKELSKLFEMIEQFLIGG